MNVNYLNFLYSLITSYPIHMNLPHSDQQPRSTKKSWSKPKVMLLSSNTILASKVHPSVLEGTGHVNTIDPNYFNSASNDNGFRGTKYEAHS